MTDLLTIHKTARKYIKAIKYLRDAEAAAINYPEDAGAIADLEVAQGDVQHFLHRLETVAGKDKAGAVVAFQLNQKYQKDSDNTILPNN